MFSAPKSVTVHIGIFGRTNVGKSTVINYLTGQNISIVSKVAGTTTDTVSKNMELSYVGEVGISIDDIKQKLLNKYKENIERDMQFGYTTIGPHRDDFKILLNNIDVRSFGSQGQQRTCALTLKLAELEYFRENTGEYPVLLLDDVLSELDSSRQQKLLERIKDIQTIITCTSFNFDISATKFHIKDGNIISIEE